MLYCRWPKAKARGCTALVHCSCSNSEQCAFIIKLKIKYTMKRNHPKQYRKCKHAMSVPRKIKIRYPSATQRTTPLGSYSYVGQFAKIGFTNGYANCELPTQSASAALLSCAGELLFLIRRSEQLAAKWGANVRIQMVCELVRIANYQHSRNLTYLVCQKQVRVGDTRLGRHERAHA